MNSLEDNTNKDNINIDDNSIKQLLLAHINEMGFSVENENDTTISLFAKTILSIVNSLNLNINQASLIIKELLEFKIKTLTEENKSETNTIEVDLYKSWGHNKNMNLSLLKRALHWLGLLEEQEYSKPFYTVNQLVVLGSMLSEDKLINTNSSNNNFSISKDEAIKQRKALVENKDFMQSLNNKVGSSHKEAIKQLNNLHSIIANSK